MIKNRARLKKGWDNNGVMVAAKKGKDKSNDGATINQCWSWLKPTVGGVGFLLKVGD